MRETEAQGLSAQCQGSGYKATDSLPSEPARHTAQCSEDTPGKGTSHKVLSADNDTAVESGQGRPSCGGDISLKEEPGALLSSEGQQLPRPAG